MSSNLAPCDQQKPTSGLGLLQQYYELIRRLPNFQLPPLDWKEPRVEAWALKMLTIAWNTDKEEKEQVCSNIKTMSNHEEEVQTVQPLQPSKAKTRRKPTSAVTLPQLTNNVQNNSSSSSEDDDLFDTEPPESQSSLTKLPTSPRVSKKSTKTRNGLLEDDLFDTVQELPQKKSPVKRTTPKQSPQVSTDLPPQSLSITNSTLDKNNQETAATIPVKTKPGQILPIKSSSIKPQENKTRNNNNDDDLFDTDVKSGDNIEKVPDLPVSKRQRKNKDETKKNSSQNPLVQLPPISNLTQKLSLLPQLPPIASLLDITAPKQGEQSKRKRTKEGNSLTSHLPQDALIRQHSQINSVNTAKNHVSHQQPLKSSQTQPFQSQHSSHPSHRPLQAPLQQPFNQLFHQRQQQQQQQYQQNVHKPSHKPSQKRPK